jgi:hypothetical protein
MEGVPTGAPMLSKIPEIGSQTYRPEAERDIAKTESSALQGRDQSHELRLFRPDVVGLTRAAAVMMAATGSGFVPGFWAGILLAHVVGLTRAATIVVATVGLRRLGHCGQSDQRKSGGRDQ